MLLRDQPLRHIGLVGALCALVLFFPALRPTPVCAADQPRTLFAEERFDRLTGPPTQYERTFTMPSSVGPPYTLHVVNGNPGRRSRGAIEDAVSSGRVLMDGVEVVSPSAFSKTTATIDRTLALTPGPHSLRVELASAPGSHLRLSIAGVIPLGDLTQPRTGHTATLLPDGRVLLAGGWSGTEPLATTERFDGGTLQSTPLTLALRTARRGHRATLLPDASLLVTGGADAVGPLPSTEQLRRDLSAADPLPASLHQARAGHTATLLPDGRVLLLGGLDVSQFPLTEGERFDARPDPLSGALYDPQTGSFIPLPDALQVPRTDHTATLLPSGLVLVAGGRNGDEYLTSAELFDPATGHSTRLTATLTTARAGHAALLQPDGSVLLIGGRQGSAPLGSLEAFVPAVQAFAPVAATLLVPRAHHTATRLPSGEILVAGGEGAGGVLAHTELLGPPPPDATPPQGQAVSPAPDALLVPRNPLVTVLVSEPLRATSVTPATVALSGSGGPVPAVVAPAEEGLLLTVTPTVRLEPGTTYTLSLSGVTDVAGNALPPTTSRFTTFPLPVLTGFTPPSGPPGSQVTLTGQHLGLDPAHLRVAVNGLPAVVTGATANAVTLLIPEAAPSGPLTVTTPGGTVTSAQPFTVLRPPVITGFSPVLGAVGTAVTVTGAHFLGVQRVTFGGVAAPFTVTNQETLTAVVPAGARSGPVTVTTPLGIAASTQPFTVVNSPPALTPIGSHTVPLGTTVSFTVGATDPDGDPVTFAVTPLPLPAHASFHSRTGRFDFTPDATQVGTFTFSFAAGDGALSSTETITVTVTGAPAGGITAVAGLVTNGAVPLANVPVRLRATGQAAVTDSQGRFLLTGVPSGRQQLVVDGFAAGHAILVAPVDLIPGVTTHLATALTLPAIDTAHVVPVTPAATTVVTNPDLPGVSLTIPPGTAGAANGSPYSGTLSISPVPEYGRPESRPVELRPGLSVTIQPAGVILNPPAPLTLPNVDRLPPGNELDLWSLSPDTGTFTHVGTMRVSADGERLETVSGGVRATAWHFALAPNPQPGQAGNDRAIGECTTCRLGSEADLEEGALSLDQAIPGVRTLGVARDLTLHYRSTSADVQPILPIDAFLSVRAAVPRTFSARLTVGGLQQGDELFWDASGLPENADSVSRLGVPFDASSLTTGRYPYELMLFSNYPFSSIGGATRRQLLLRNERGSPFGAGWTLAGLDRLYPQPDGSVVLAEGAGATKLFAAQLGVVHTQTVTAGIPGRPGTRGEVFLDQTFDMELPDAFEVWLLGEAAAPRIAPTRVDDVLELTVVRADGTTASFRHDYSNGCRVISELPPRDLTTLFRPGVNRVTLRLIDGCGGGLSSGTIVLVADHPPQELYTATFESGAGPEWTPTSVAVTPTGSHPFLGEFGNDPVRLTLRGLPPHHGLRLAFDLLVLKTWDGDGAFCCGPDAWDVRVEGGATLLHTSFSTTGFAGNNQAYPGPHPTSRNPARTGALTNDNFGYPGGNSVYRITATVPHVAEEVTFAFSGQGLQGASDESWGLDRVAVGLLTQASPELTSPPGDFSTLRRNPDGTFTRRLKDGTTVLFDAGGLQTAVTDRNGNRTTYGYDGDGRLTTLTDPAGQVTTFSYGGGRLAAITDPAGRTTRFEHDGDGNLAALLYADDSRPTFAYDPQHRLVRRTDARGLPTRYEYDHAGRLTRAILPTGTVRTLRPTQLAAVPNVAAGEGTPDRPAPLAPTNPAATFTDGRGQTSIFQLDAFGRVTQQRDALGRATTIERDAQGNPIKITRPNGAVTAMTYDAQGNLLTTTEQAIAATTTFAYESSFNQVTSITDPEGRRTSLAYDERGNPIRITDAVAQATTFAYDGRGLLTATSDALGQTTRFAYDALGRLLTTTDPLGRITALTYDAAGNVATSTDALGRVTHFTYDAFNRLAQVTDPAGGVTRYTYDGNGNLVSVADAKGQATTFAYDELNRLAATTDPLGHAEAYAYDGADNLVERLTPKGDRIAFAYDAVGQLRTKSLPGGLVTAYTYDLVGNLTGVTDPDSALTMAHDLANRLTSVSTAGSPAQPSVTLSYSYDRSGNRLTMGDPTGTTRYAYDALNRLTALISPAGGFGLTYDALSRRTGLTLPNGTQTTYAYDAASQVVAISHQRSAIGPEINRAAYTYNAVGNRTALQDRRGVQSFGYDALDRLSSASHPFLLDPQTFAYDPIGNRTTGGSLHNAGNQLTEDAGFIYAYDANGNLVRKTGKGSGIRTEYTYDAENRLIRVDEFAGGATTPFATSSYRYDGLGRRIEKTGNGQIRRYIYDGEDILLEYDGTNVLQTRYTHGPGIDEPLALTRGGATLYYHADGLGTVTDLTDATGALAQTYAYDAWGTLLEQTGSVEQPYTYTGRELDPDTGLYYYRARYYEPKMGRFLEKDPVGFLGGDINLYRYAFGNVVNFRDPSGLDALECFGANFGFAFDSTNAFFFEGYTRLARTAVGMITSGAVAQTTGFTSIGMAWKPLLAGEGVANLGFGATIASVAANSVTNAVISTVALETGIIVGSALDASLKTFVFGACPSTPCQ